MRLFAPLYLSNECINNCKYCGFSRDNPILRVTLDVDEVVARSAASARRVFATFCSSRANIRNLLSNNYLADCVRALHAEISQRSRSKSGRWKRRNIVRSSRPARKASSFIRKLTTAAFMPRCTPPGRNAISTGGSKVPNAPTLPDFADSASARSIGLSRLAVRSDRVAAHADYLLTHCWKAQITMRLPRLRPAPANFSRSR